MTRKVAFFEGWPWFKFNNLGLPLGTNLKFYTSLSKGLKLKVRKFWRLIPTVVEVTGEKLVQGPFCAPMPILNRVKACVRYFSLFLKDECISSLVRTKYIEKKFSLQLFFLPTVSRTFILLGYQPRATHFLETSCLEKITECVIER